jgi:hypothetical protein
MCTRGGLCTNARILVERLNYPLLTKPWSVEAVVERLKRLYFPSGFQQIVNWHRQREEINAPCSAYIQTHSTQGTDTTVY